MVPFAEIILATGLYSDKFYPAFLFQKFFASTFSLATFEIVMEIVYAATNQIGEVIADKFDPKTVATMGYSFAGIDLYCFLLCLL